MQIQGGEVVLVGLVVASSSSRYAGDAIRYATQGLFVFIAPLGSSVVLAGAVLLAGCDLSKEDRSTMLSPEHSKGTSADPSERPGAIVIRPRLDPALQYDPDAKRVFDRNSGEYFVPRLVSSMNGIYEAIVFTPTDNPVAIYRYRSGDFMLPSGEKKFVYEVTPQSRGLGGQLVTESNKSKSLGSQWDIERLGSFLRAQKIGFQGGVEKGEIVLVDRRLDSENWMPNG